MTKEKRNGIFSEYKEYRIRKRIQSMVCVENATYNFTLRKEIRIEHRLQYSKNSNNPIDARVRAEMQKRMENRLNNFNDDRPGNGSHNGGGGKQ